ncbi:MAG: hypothetical protein COA94_05495 [Rickettsiales bacterium]|nr:MAG: hypothetical protein COA94_05495 [Rickettsiales bacterium]
MFFGIDIDMAIVVTFLVATLIVGLKYSGNINTIKDYALGGRNFSTAALVATITATWASGSGFFTTLSRTYTDGFFYLFATLFMGVQLLLVAFVFVPRMGEFLGSISVADAMGKLYGKEARVITAISGAVGSVGFIAVQFKAFGNIVSYFMGIPSEVSIITSGIIVTIYSSLGGIKAVTITDMLQIFAFCFTLPLVGIMIWNQLYFTDFSLTNAFQASKFDVGYVLDVGKPKFWEMILLMLYFMMPNMIPINFQRISIAKNLEQVKKAWAISAGLLIFLKLSIAWIPFLIFNIDENIPANQLLGYIIDNYTYTGLKGLIIVGVIAMAMSTADSLMNTGAVLFAHDICGVLKIWQRKELILAKIFSFSIGGGAIMLALTELDFLGIILVAQSFYMPLVTVPLLFSILGFRSSSKSVLIGMGAGFCTVVLWKISGIKADPIIFGMIANVVFLFGSHYLLGEKGGWVGIKDKEYLDKQKRIRQKNKGAFLRWVQEFNFFNLCRKYSPKDDLTYTGFGVYSIICTITTMYSTQVELLAPNGQIVLAIYQIMMVTGTMMAMYPVWPLSIKKIIKERVAQTWWNPAIFYMLAFFSTFFVLISEFGQLQFVIFTVNTILLILLAGWRLASLMIITGFYGGIEFFKYYKGIDDIDMAIGSPLFVFMYSLILIGALLVIFLKPKQEHLEQTEDKVEDLESEVTTQGTKITTLNKEVGHYSQRVSNQAREIERLGATAQKILNNVNHELRLPVGNVMNFAEMLRDGLDKFSDDQLKMISEEVYNNSNRLSSMILNMLDLAVLEAKKIELKKEEVNFSKLVRARAQNCRDIYAQDKKALEFRLNIEDDVMVFADANYICQMIDNLVINAINFSEKGIIAINVDREKYFVSFAIRDEGKGIPKDEIFDIFTPFKMGSNMESSAEGRGVGLALCKSVIEAHGGEISAESRNVGALFRVCLPYGEVKKEK